MDVDCGQLVYPSLKDVAVVVNLDELGPVGGRASRRSKQRRLRGFAKMGQDLPDRSWLRDERDEPDIAAAVRALKWKLLRHPRHEPGPRNPGGVVRTGLVMRIAAASRGVTAAPMPAGHGLALLADVADGERRDCPP